MKKLDKIKFISFLIILIGLFFTGYIYDFNFNQFFNNLKEISETQPVLAAIIFISLLVIVKFTFVPMTSTSILAGFLFGVFWGAVISVLAIAFSSTLMFFLARYLGRGFVQRLVADRLTWVDRYNYRLRDNGFMIILFFRIVPVLPLPVINLGLGLSRVKFWEYFGATILGSLPGVILLVNAGKYITDLDNPKLYLYLGLYILMIIFTFYLANKLKKNNEKTEN